jgi:hypothetical protein
MNRAQAFWVSMLAFGLAFWIGVAWLAVWLVAG